MRRLVSRCFIFLLVLLLIAACNVTYVLRRFLVHILQTKAVDGALRNSPVSIGALAVRGWSLELTHVRIDNVQGNWTTPFALHMNAVRLSFGGPGALLSLLQLPAAAAVDSPSILRFGALDFIVGFRVKALEVLEFTGVTVHVENAAAASEERVPKDVRKVGVLHKDPLNAS